MDKAHLSVPKSNLLSRTPLCRVTWAQAADTGYKQPQTTTLWRSLPVPASSNLKDPQKANPTKESRSSHLGKLSPL